jgi:predicted ATPase
VGFEIAEDKIEVVGTFCWEDPDGTARGDGASGTLRFFRTAEGKVEVESLGVPFGANDMAHITNTFQLPPQKTLSLEAPLYFLLGALDMYHDIEFREIEVFDIDPKSPKFGVQIAAKADLEDDGGNLALVLKTILENAGQKQTLSNLMRDLLPFVDDLRVEPFADRTFLFRLEEVFFPDEYLPASLLSDGTINVTALIVALYFERRALVAFEEPERNLHPSLLAKVVDMLRDASRRKQVIISTHSPEVVRHAKLEDLILVSRGESGFSRLSRPSERETVRDFLKNEIGIEDLFLQNMLEI